MSADHTTWSGMAVYCPLCAVAFTPVMTDDGWRMPLHPVDTLPGSGFFGRSCPGSLAGVERPVPLAARMEQRIEEHVLAAMPPDPADDPVSAWLGCPLPACPPSNTCGHGCIHRPHRPRRMAP